MLLLLLACKGPAPDDTASACPGSPAAGTVEVLATGFEVDGVVGTEGVAFSPDGRLFVGGSAAGGAGFVAEVQPDGSWAVLADVPGSVGLAWWQDQLVVASGAGEGGVVGVDVDSGATTWLATGVPSANFPLPTPWGSLLVATHTVDRIYEVSAAGAVSIWADALETPNGLAFSPDGAWLYVANTYGNPNVLGRIPVSGGVAGAWEPLAELPVGSTQDGLAIDAAGAVYVALNVPGQVVRVQPDGAWEVVAEEVQWAASLAFGVGPAWDACSLIATSLFDEELYRVAVGALGR